MKIENPKIYEESLNVVADWLLDKLEYMKVEEIRDSLLGSVQMFIYHKFYEKIRTISGGKAQVSYSQVKPVPEKYSDILRYISGIYEDNVSQDGSDTVQRRCRNAYTFYCWDIKLRSEGLGTTLR